MYVVVSIESVNRGWFYYVNRGEFVPGFSLSR